MGRKYCYTADPTAVVHFDWITAVLPSRAYELDVDPIVYATLLLERLGVTGLTWTPLAHGIYTYERAVSYSGIIIGADRQAPDVMIQISGMGLELVEEILSRQQKTVEDFIKAVLRYGGSFSRVDACTNFINYDFHYSPRYLDREARAGHLVTAARRCRFVDSYSATGALTDRHQADTGSEEGATLYVGKSPKQLRIYNKLAERSEKLNIRYDMKSWFRWEFELNGDQAMAFVNAYVTSGYDLAQTWIDWLASSYRWIQVIGHQEKRSRYPNADWYEALVSGAKRKIRVRREPVSDTYARTDQWVNRQVMPTLTAWYAARLQKYQKNGLSYVDADRLAQAQVMQEVKSRMLAEDFDLARVSAWLQEDHPLE